MQQLPDQHIIDDICTCERVSGVLWIIIGILQTLSILLLYLPGPIVGIWNIVAAVSRFKAIPMIKMRDARIPALFSREAGLIIMLVLNLILGGVVGVILVAFDFYIRHKVLSNSHLFTNVVHPTPANPT